MGVRRHSDLTTSAKPGKGESSDGNVEDSGVCS